MPPKPSSKSRRSTQSVPEIVHIYDILADKENDDSVRTISKKLEALMKQNNEAIEKSFHIFILKACGLDAYVDKINWRDPLQSLTDLLQQISEENQKIISSNELFIINQKSKFHKQFLKRVTIFLQVALSDELSLPTDTQIVKNMYQYLLVISKCKMRNVRNCSIVLSSIAMKRLASFYQQLINLKNAKRANKILALIDQGYLTSLIKPRFKDVDELIRQKAFNIACEIFIQLQNYILSAKKLNQMFTHPITENKTKITELCIRSITKIFQMEKQKLGHSASKQLCQYAIQTIKPLQELVLLPNKNSILAMDALLAIHVFKSDFDSLKPKIIAKIFEIHGYQKFQEGLKKAVFIFFKSLLPECNTKQQLSQHRSLLIIQITHLLCSINSSKLLSTILHEFFFLQPALFDFDQMFLLLFTQYYHKDGSDIQLQDKELSVICTMICQFNIFLRSSKIADKDKHLQNYNKNVLTNCKQIFYQKIEKHPSLSHLYLRLFSHIVIPVLGNTDSYLNFVEQKTLDFIKQQQYFSFSGDNLVLTQQIIHECTATLQLFGLTLVNEQKLINAFNIQKCLQHERIGDIQIIKMAALCSRFSIKRLNTQSTIKKVLNNYSRSLDKIIKLEVLSYVYHSHKNLFSELFHSPSQAKHEQYMIIRNVFIDFLLQVVLQSSSQDTVVKLGAFNIVCRMLKLISNTKISDIPALYFEPSPNQLDIFYQFVLQYIHFDQQETMNETTMMMATVSLQSQQVRQQILNNLFSVYCECFKFVISKPSIRFMAKLMLSSNNVLKSSEKRLDNLLNQLARAEIASQNSNKFIFWRFFMELTNQIGNEQTQKIQNIINKMIDCYYKHRKGQAQSKSALSNKLMLFIADSIDKYISNSNYQGLMVLKSLLHKTYRRFAKETLQRLSIFYSSKVENIEDKLIKTMKQYLSKISKTGKKGNKQKQEKSDKEQESSQESNAEQKEQKESDSENAQNLDTSNRRETRKHENVMQQKNSKEANQRNLRSKTKRKNV